MSGSNGVDVLWANAQKNLSVGKLEELAAYRNYSVSTCQWMAKHGLIGIHHGSWAFPNRDPSGRLRSIHYKKKAHKDGEVDHWVHYPGNVDAHAFDIGKAEAPNVALFESQWDMFAFIELVGPARIDSGFWRVCATRGNSGTKCLAGLFPYAGSTIYLFTQNDRPGELWEERTLKVLGREALIVSTPTAYKDLNEALQNGGDNSSLVAWMAKARKASFKPPPPQSFGFGYSNRNGAKPDPKPFQPLSGGSVMHYAKREVDLSVSLLGNRWLSRRTSCLIIAPSGIGKSHAVIQGIAQWGAMLPFLGIHTTEARPLRSFVVQSEDDDNDLVEMCQMTQRMGLSEQQIDLIDQNTHIEWYNTFQNSDQFFAQLREWHKEWQPWDTLLINPLTSYCEDIYDPRYVTPWIAGMNKLMLDLNCGVIAVLPTPKTIKRGSDKFQWNDWIYSGQGRADLPGWARSIIAIDVTNDPGVYKFIAAKRQDRIGWPVGVREKFFRHSVENGINLWVPAEADNPATKTPRDPALLLQFLSFTDMVTTDQVIAKASKHMGRDAVKAGLKVLHVEGFITQHEVKHGGKGRPYIAWLRVPDQTEDSKTEGG